MDDDELLVVEDEGCDEELLDFFLASSDFDRLCCTSPTSFECSLLRCSFLSLSLSLSFSRSRSRSRSLSLSLSLLDFRFEDELDEYSVLLLLVVLLVAEWLLLDEFPFAAGASSVLDRLALSDEDEPLL